MKLLVLILSVTCVYGATNPLVAPVPVPSSPYLPRIYKYVDAMLEDPACKTNLHYHQNWLRVLYTLSELSAKPKYRDAADTALRHWLEEIPAPNQPITRPWMLWDRCFQIAPEPSKRYAFGVLESVTTNHPGFYLRTFTAAYAHTTNEAFLRAIDTLIKRYESRESPLPPLSFTIDAHGCSHLLPEPLASRLGALVQLGDDAAVRQSTPIPYMLRVSRYQNTGRTDFLQEIRRNANVYLYVHPADRFASPFEFGHRISLLLAAWRSFPQQQYLDKARAFADFTLKEHFERSPELTPGVDTLALSLVELHLHILYITAVRYPPNTVDR